MNTTTKISMKEFSEDCKELGISARRYLYAKKYLTDKEEETAEVEYEKKKTSFASKYSIRKEDARAIALLVSDSCDLGLSF